MSVLIKGMEMPSIEMKWTIRYGADGKWYAIDTNAETTDGEWHEIVPVPPHGRLIDVSELEKRLYDYGTGTTLPIDWSDIANAPTIIEAGGGE